MNKLLELSFERMGYTREFMHKINCIKYADHIFLDEDGLILALQKAHKEHAKIVVIPDFDMDGISAGCIFYTGLSLLGFDVSLYMPDVVSGYGFEVIDIDTIYEEHPDCRYILTCDVGITCTAAVQYARDRYDCHVLVTDHHPENYRNPLMAEFNVDPSRDADDSDFKGICGAYMAYHVMMMYARLTGNEAIISLMSHLSLFASLGSAGDLMPLLYDTRNVVIKGLKEFNNLLDCEDLTYYFGCSLEYLPDCYIAAFENLRRMHFILMGENILKPGDVTFRDYGFTYCPLFNSFKRMGRPLDIVYDLLYQRYDDDDPTVRQIVGNMIDLNNDRKSLVEDHFKKLVNDKNQVFAPYIYISDANPGLLGLLAMKLMQHNQAPCLVLNSNGFKCSGSGRIPDIVDPKDIRTDYVDIGGHGHAFGIVIDIIHLSTYGELLGTLYDTAVDKLMGEDLTDPRLPVGINGVTVTDDDPQFRIRDLKDYDTCVDYTYEVKKHGPFGSGLPEPEHKLYVRRSDITEIRTMGKDNRHLKLILDHNIHCVFFGAGDLSGSIRESGANTVYGFVGQFQMNEYKGYSNLQFMVSEQIC